MYLHPFLVSPLVTVLVAGIVYADARRRALERRTRWRWTVSVGLASLGGFIGAFAFDNVLSRAYFLVLGRPVVVHSPRELLTGLFIVGVTISAIAVLVYGIGSRFGALRVQPRS